MSVLDKAAREPLIEIFRVWFNADNMFTYAISIFTQDLPIGITYQVCFIYEMKNGISLDTFWTLNWEV